MFTSMYNEKVCTSCGKQHAKSIGITWEEDNLDADIMLCPKCVGEMIVLLEHWCVDIVKSLSE